MDSNQDTKEDTISLKTSTELSPAKETEAITIQDVDMTPTPPAESMESGWINLLPMVAVFAIFYFFLLRPQEKKRREKEELVSAVKKGEDVVTSSGIFGTVKKINDSDNTVNLEIATGVEVKILKTAIADITSRPKKISEKDQKTAEKTKLDNKTKK